MHSDAIRFRPPRLHSPIIIKQLLTGHNRPQHNHHHFRAKRHAHNIRRARMIDQTAERIHASPAQSATAALAPILAICRAQRVKVHPRDLQMPKQQLVQHRATALVAHQLAEFRVRQQVSAQRGHHHRRANQIGHGALLLTRRERVHLHVLLRSGPLAMVHRERRYRLHAVALAHDARHPLHRLQANECHNCGAQRRQMEAIAVRVQILNDRTLVRMVRVLRTVGAPPAAEHGRRAAAARPQAQPVLAQTVRAPLMPQLRQQHVQIALLDGEHLARLQRALRDYVAAVLLVLSDVQAIGDERHSAVRREAQRRRECRLIAVLIGRWATIAGRRLIGERCSAQRLPFAQLIGNGWRTTRRACAARHLDIIQTQRVQFPIPINDRAPSVAERQLLAVRLSERNRLVEIEQRIKVMTITVGGGVATQPALAATHKLGGSAVAFDRGRW